MAYEPPYHHDPPAPHTDHFSDRAGSTFSSTDLPEEGQTIELREERLIAHKEMRHIGDVEIRTEVEEIPGRLEVEALREEVEVEHVPIGRVVAEREGPRHEGELLVVPVYEEELVVTKRLVLREELRIRRLPTTETRLFEDTLRREHLVIEDSTDAGLVHERYPTDEGDAYAEPGDGHHEGFLENLKRKVMQP